jgi:hypothetical protein
LNGRPCAPPPRRAASPMSYHKQWATKEDERHGSAGQWQQWSCGFCSTENYNWASQAKKCKQCGLKRTYAMAPSETKSKEQAVCWNAQWEPRSYAQALMGSATPPPKPSTELSHARVEAALSDAEVRAKASVNLKSIMAALEALPLSDEFAPERVMLGAKAEEAKAKIRDAKPIGARIDGCKAAITRAQHRLEQSTAQWDEAKINMQQASQELVQFKQDLAGLELSVASEQQDLRQVPSSVEQLADSLTKVLKEMTSSPAVPRQLIDETTQHMHHLYAGIQKIAAAAREVAAPAERRQLQRSTSSPPAPVVIEVDMETPDQPRRLWADTVDSETPDPQRRLAAKTPHGNTAYGEEPTPCPKGWHGGGIDIPAVG